MKDVFDEFWKEFQTNDDFRILSITLTIFLIIVGFGLYTMCAFA